MKVRVVMLAFPIVGRSNPMVQLAKRLSCKQGVVVTLATTSALASKLSSITSSYPNLSIAALSLGDQADPLDTLSVDEYSEWFEKMAPPSLANLIKELDHTPRCLIYDSSQIWALDLARQLGLLAAPFFPQSCAVSLIFRHVFEDVLQVHDQRDRESGLLSAPGLPPMALSDLPSFVNNIGTFPLLEKLVLRQFKNFHDADFQFFNSFDVLEHHVIDWMKKRWPEVMSIGPTIPSMFLDKELLEDTEYGLSVFDTEQVEACMRWLDSKDDASTLYVSFGSLAALSDAQMQELALALLHCGTPFLWVVRPSEKAKLPQDFTQQLESGTAGGMIVTWCPQLAVLSHRAIACFFSHCGWNSTLEAVSSGVPIVAMPQWADQPTNAMYVEQVWRIGIRVKPDPTSGIVSSQGIMACIGEAMHGERATEMRSNASNLMTQARAAMLPGGSSYVNLDHFVAKLINA
uniref:Glycosyltransferase n=1 Tax=Fagopyrum tataricum TaxID=62330 RepID=A0A6B7ES22_FAGTA|nr:UGT74like1 [Fagopyrum tataricum]